METLNYKSICLQAIDTIKQTGLFILNERKNFTPSNVEIKGSHDYVSYVDKTAEKQLVEGLKTILPEAGFITEEQTVIQENKYYNWIIDPLDGTTNFIHGLPLYSISVALREDENIIMGIVYEINLDECFYAWKDGGAYLNGMQISVTNTKDLDNSLIATGFPYYDYSRLSQYMNLFEDLMQHTRGIRRLGSAAVDLAYVACGRFEVFYEYGLRPWDVAAGVLIVQEAGGIVTDFNNGNNFLFGKELIASNKGVFEEFSKKLQHYMNNSTLPS